MPTRQSQGATLTYAAKILQGGFLTHVRLLVSGLPGEESFSVKGRSQKLSEYVSPHWRCQEINGMRGRSSRAPSAMARRMKSEKQVECILAALESERIGLSTPLANRTIGRMVDVTWKFVRDLKCAS